MNKTKWYSKLVNLAVAFALVFSLGAMALPVAAVGGGEITVDVSTENTTYCCCDVFNVTAVITVPMGAEGATNVSATMSWNPECGLELKAPNATQEIPAISEGEPWIVEWQVHCVQTGLVAITVEVTADPPYQGPVYDQWYIEQESANLYVHIVDPEPEAAFMVCSTFNVTFDIVNDGCQGAELIRVTVDPGVFAEVVIDDVGQGAGVIFEEPAFDLGADNSTRMTVELHCTEVGEDVIHVDIPYARDLCSEKEIKGLSDLVGIIQYEELVPSCNATPQLTKTGYNVTFTADATGGIPFDPDPPGHYSWSWDFDDGSGTSTNKDDVYAYSSPGFYDPVVTVTDSWGNSANCTPGTIEVRAHPTIVSCNATPNPTKIGFNTTFNATAIDGIGPYTWAWDFETDGTKDVTGLADPTYVWAYPAAGSYNATVYMSDAWANNATCNVTVEVREHPLVEVCGANYTPTKVGVNTTFTATVTGGVGPYTWVWDFDNGDTMPDVTPDPPPSVSTVFYTYSAPGTYNATVNVTDALDNPASCNFTLEVKDHPAITACNATPPETKVDDQVYFDAWVIGGVPDYKWSWDVDDDGSEDFGETTTGTHSHVGPYTYSIPGTYNVSVSLLDKFDNPASCNFTIVVHPSLNVTCDAEPDPALVCHAVNFTAEKVGGVPDNPYIWEWEFKDSEGAVIGTASTQNTTFPFMCVGNYSGTVTATDEVLGNTANCTANVTVIIEPPELISPILNAQLTSKNVTFEWEDIGCCNYTLQVWQKEESGQKVLLVETGKDNTWTGPIFNGEWRWQVTATESCNVSATSDTWFFRVDQPGPSVTVNSPNGGEVWAPGSAQTITWFATPTDGVIDLYLSSDGGGVWTLIKSGEDNDGAYPWTVPAIESDQCLVKVVITDAGTGTAEDISDNVFTIGAPTTELAVEVSAPEQVNEGEEYFVTAVVSNTGSEDAENVTATIEINGNAGLATGTLPQTIGDIAVGGSEAVEWKLECTGAGGVNVAVSADGDNTVPASGSAAIEQIAAIHPVVEVKYPNGGDTFLGGSQVTITWSAKDPRALGFAASQIGDFDIDIYLSSDGGGSWSNKTTDEDNDGAFVWTVDDIRSTRCLIRVDATDGNGNTGSDTSDGVFTITSEPACVDSYNITLADGMNLVSLPLIPDSNNITDVLAGISGANVTRVKTYDAGLGDFLVYNPLLPWGHVDNTLKEMNDGVGYWVMMDGAGMLNVTGQCMPEPPAMPSSYDVYAEWNMIGFKSIISRSHEDYLRNVAGDYTVIWGYDPADGYFLVFPSPPGKGQLEPGLGYWIWMGQDGTIIPPGN